MAHGKMAGGYGTYTYNNSQQIRLNHTDLRRHELLRRRELQDANNYLKTLIGALPDTLMELDVDGRIYQYHAPATGSPVPTPEQGGSWNISDIFPEGVTAVILKALADAAHTGGSRGATYALGAEPGAVACFELSVTRLPDSDGLPSRFVVLARELAGRVSDTENSLECH